MNASASAREDIQVGPALLKAGRHMRGLHDLESFLAAESQDSTTELLESLLAAALQVRASDIHVEPRGREAFLRARIDGVLQNAGSLPGTAAERLVNRVKLVSGIKLNVADRPQDGRFTFKAQDASIEVRASTLPAEEGEAVVLRILNPKDLVDLEQLGLRDDLLVLFRREITKPNGMIVATGPTGSGKTTTLYAFLKEIRRPEIKIVTIEDPIEYHLEGVSQTQVAPAKKYTFASGLRAIVRQDPDVILVGEIRDQETAEIALQASLTGHLVLTTLHTNDAAGTVSRLLSLRAEAANIAPALSLIIAQRLVRRVCPECSVQERPTKEELAKIQSWLQELPPSLAPKTASSSQIPRAKACEACGGTGYRGRIGIFEAIQVAETMEEYILKEPSISDLRGKAKENGMVEMRLDGLLKVLEGITTLEEVERVTGE